MKKPRLPILIGIFLIISIYLNRSYAYFYNFLDQHKLTAPSSPANIVMENHSNNQLIKYVALGDSLTAGVGTSSIKSSYPYLLSQKLSSKNNVILANFAHAGDNSEEILTTQLPKALAYKPDLITLLIGINDIHNLKSTNEFKENLTHIVSQLKDTGARIYLLSIPYLGSDKTVFFPYNFILDLRTRQFNNIIKKIAGDFGVNYIDLYSLRKSANFYSSDQFHPSEEGYKEWAKIINVN